MPNHLESLVFYLRNTASGYTSAEPARTIVNLATRKVFCELTALPILTIVELLLYVRNHAATIVLLDRVQEGSSPS